MIIINCNFMNDFSVDINKYEMKRLAMRNFGR